MFHSYLRALALAFSSISHISRATNTTKTARVLYFLDNLPNNSVVAMNIGPDGLLSDGSRSPTGGKGAPYIFAGTTAPAVPAALDSSGSVVVYQDVLLAVNSGSNTVSMFRINPDSPTELTLIGKPVDTQGDFPTTIAISPILKQACVGNAGARTSITCFHISRKGLRPVSPPLSFSINQTTPPLAVPPQGVVPQALPVLTSISFNIDSSALLITVTGSPALGFKGYLGSYPVINQVVSNPPKLDRQAGGGAPFSTTNIPRTSKILVADALIGAAIIDLSTSGPGNNYTQQLIHIPGQNVTCWSVLSSYTNTAFVTDAFVNPIVEIDPTSGSIVHIVPIDNGNVGNLDLVAVNKNVYAMSPGFADETAAIVVLDVSGGPGTARMVQNFQPKGFAKGSLAVPQGLALY